MHTKYLTLQAFASSTSVGSVIERRADPAIEEKLQREKTNSAKMAALISSLRDEILDESEYQEAGYRSGNLSESDLWQVAGGIERPTCFTRTETIQVPRLFLGVLVDCSGSMSSDSRMSQARTVAMALMQGIPEQAKIQTALAGHTEVYGNVVLYMIKKPGTPIDFNAIRHLTAQSGNLDGYALIAYAREISSSMAPGETGLITLICDGSPCHNEKAMRDAIAKCRSEYNLHTMVIGISSTMTKETCDELYGPNNYVLVPRIRDAAQPIVTKLNSMLKLIAPV